MRVSKCVRDLQKNHYPSTIEWEWICKRRWLDGAYKYRPRRWQRYQWSAVVTEQLLAQTSSRRKRKPFHSVIMFKLMVSRWATRVVCVQFTGSLMTRVWRAYFSVHLMVRETISGHFISINYFAKNGKNTRWRFHT